MTLAGAKAVLHIRRIVSRRADDIICQFNCSVSDSTATLKPISSNRSVPWSVASSVITAPRSESGAHCPRHDRAGAPWSIAGASRLTVPPALRLSTRSLPLRGCAPTSDGAADRASADRVTTRGGIRGGTSVAATLADVGAARVGTKEGDIDAVGCGEAQAVNAIAATITIKSERRAELTGIALS